MNLTKTNWPLGYTPNADPINGDPNGLIRMDNIQQEETGVMSLVRGIQELNGDLPDWVYKGYSRIINNAEFIWIALNYTGSYVLRSSNNFGTFDTILTGGGSKACFGEAFGNVLISCGSQFLKDNGTSTPIPLGLQTPTQPPVVNQINQQRLDMASAYTFVPVVGQDFQQLTGSGLIFVDPTNLFGTMDVFYPGGLDTVHFGIPGLNSNVDPGEDLFTMLFQPGDTSQFTYFQVIFDLDGFLGNTFTYTFESSSLNQQGIDVQSTLSIPRSAFTRTGNNAQFDWTTVQRIRINGQGIVYNKFVSGEMAFTGGVQGTLNSDYTYICYMVANNGTYQALSGPSPVSAVASIFNGYASVQLPASSDPQVNACFLYRRTAIDNRTNTGSAGAQDGLPNYYLVAMSTPGAVVQDIFSDTALLETNIQANLFLQSVQDIDDIIYNMEGLYNARMLYLGNQNIYLSDTLDPDAIDTRFILKVSGDPAEKNLFIKAITNNTLILATTKDLYYISGTLTAQPDDTLDVTIQSIGEAYPPLSSDFTFAAGNLYYIASTGLRLTTGSNSINVPGLELLFQNENRAGVPAVALAAANEDEYTLCVAKGKLYTALPLTDGTRRLFILSLSTGLWRLQYTDPVCVFSTQTGLVLLGYNLSTNNNLSGGLFQLDVGNGITAANGDFVEGIPFTLQTVADCNQQPRNRKDTFTLKIIANTGGSSVSVYVLVDNGPMTLVGQVNTSIMQTTYFDMQPFNLGFRYSFYLCDVNLVTIFKLYELTLEYEARPEQLNFKRILNDNLGTVCRKRFVNYAFVIDTLGNNVSFIPIVDNVAADGGSSLTTPTKETFIHYFDEETIGIDIGGTLTGGPFEFYALNTEEILSEKMPVPVQFLVIPANNYGTPNRKRHTSYKFQINTRGGDVVFTPILDSIPYTTAVFNTAIKQTVEYYFPIDTDVIGIDIGGTLSCATPFEFYGVITPQEVEALPSLLKSYYLSVSNLGTPARKRLKTIPIVINTMGADVNFIITIDGIGKEPLTINTTFKQTVFYYFNYDSVGVDFEATLQSIADTPFECYGLSLQDCIAQTLPTPTEYYLIPPNNYGTPARKRFTSYKFQIDTRGEPVTFTPIVDGLEYATLIFTTNNGEETIEYFFNQVLDVKGIDIGGTLTGGPFEFYGPVVPEKVETLPSRLESFYPPHDNFGVAARKRIRTIPLIIYTYGQPVIYTPNVDGVNYPPASFTTTYKQTVYYFFVSDMFGIDVGGNLRGAFPFEFYGFGTPEDVEVLPVPKIYDQFQPLRFDKIGKIFSIRIRIISTGDVTIPFSIFGDISSTLPANTTALFSSSFQVVPFQDNVIETDLPKNINGTILRITLGPTVSPFHRYDLFVKIATSGMESDSKWIQMR